MSIGIFGKIIIGILLIVGSAYWIWNGPSHSTLLAYLSSALNNLGYSAPTNTALTDFLTVVNGAIPPLVLLIGIFIVWLEYDEWKIERELKREEEKRVRRRKRRK